MIRELANKLYRGDQSWHYDTIWEIVGTNMQPIKAEVKICRNAYDLQSYGRISLFSRTELKWNVVATTIGPKLKCLGISYTEKDELAILSDHLDALQLDTEDLVKEVCMILGIKAKVKK